MPHDAKIVEQIVLLEPTPAIEAGRFAAAEIAGNVPPDAKKQMGEWASKNPFSHLEDIETLAKLVLAAQALSGEEARTSVAIAGAGRQNVVLGGLEIVALAGLGVIALQNLLTGGKVKKTDFKVVKDKDGKLVVTIGVNETPLKLSDSLAAVLQPILGAIAKAKGNSP